MLLYICNKYKKNYTIKTLDIKHYPLFSTPFLSCLNIGGLFFLYLCKRESPLMSESQGDQHEKEHSL